MNSLKMKIVGFDENKSTLLVKFASDLAEKPIEDYDFHYFNVVENDDGVVLDDILKALAQNGWNIALQQEIAEQTSKDNEKVQLYKALVDKEFDFTADDLFATPAAEEQPITEGLMVI
jgi:hypothetical protein